MGDEVPAVADFKVKVAVVRAPAGSKTEKFRRIARQIRAVDPTRDRTRRTELVAGVRAEGLDLAPIETPFWVPLRATAVLNGGQPAVPAWADTAVEVALLSVPLAGEAATPEVS